MVKMTDKELRMVVRRQIIQENMFRDAYGWLKRQGQKIVKETKQFFINLKQELEQSAEGTALLTKMAIGDELTPKETTFLKQQLLDIGKGIPLLGLVILPGGSIAVMILVKLAAKLGIDLMPSSFKDKGVDLTATSNL